MTAKIQFKNRGTLNINYLFNSKIPFTQMVIIWNTTEEQMLRAILRKYVSEKVIIKGINPKNNIINAAIGKSGLMLLTIEKSFFSIFHQLYYALYNSTVKVNGSYSKLVSDINKGCTVYCTGKIKTLIKNLSGSSSKIDKFKDAINNLKIKDRQDVNNAKNDSLRSIKLDTRSEIGFREIDKYALALVLNNTNIDFWFESNMIYTNDFDYLIESIERSDFNILKTQKFRYKAGDEKCQKILDIMFSELYNFKYTKSDNFDKRKDVISKMKF